MNKEVAELNGVLALQANEIRGIIVRQIVADWEREGEGCYTDYKRGKGIQAMICKRCGSACPGRSEGYCFHCLVATDIEKALLDKAGRPITLKDAGIDEGFPDWEKPTIKNQREEMGR